MKLSAVSLKIMDGIENVIDTIRWLVKPGSRWRVTDLLTGQVYDHDGDEMYYPGLYVDLPPWGFHILTAMAVEPVMATTGWAQEEARAGR